MSELLMKKIFDERRAKLIKKAADFKVQNSDMYVNYSLHDGYGNLVKEYNSQPCFAGLYYNYVDLKKKADKDSNLDIRYLRYKPTNIKIKRRTAIRWIHLCQESGAISDSYQNPKDILENGIFIDMRMPWWTIDRVYTSLCCLRFMSEFSKVVKIIVYLCTKLNIEFWNALVYAHGAFGSYGHSFLGFGSSSYSAYGFSQNSKQDIVLAKNLKDYFSKRDGPFKTKNIWETMENKTFSWKTAEYLANGDPVLLEDTLYLLTEKSQELINYSTKEIKEFVTKEGIGKK